MSIVVLTLAWPMRLETTTGFLPDSQRHRRVEMPQAPHRQSRTLSLLAQALYEIGQSVGMAPTGQVLAWENPFGRLHTQLIGKFCCRLLCSRSTATVSSVEVHSTSPAFCFRAFHDAASFCDDKRCLDSERTPFEIQIVPRQRQRLSSPQPSEDDQVDTRPHVVDLRRHPRQARLLLAPCQGCRLLCSARMEGKPEPPGPARSAPCGARASWRRSGRCGPSGRQRDPCLRSAIWFPSLALGVARASRLPHHPGEAPGGGERRPRNGRRFFVPCSGR